MGEENITKRVIPTKRRKELLQMIDSKEIHRCEKERLKKLQEQFAEKVVRPLVEKMIEDGVLPQPTKPVTIDFDLTTSD